MLKDLGYLASGRAIDPDSKSGMKELWDWYGLQSVEEGKDVHIAVVSHASFPLLSMSKIRRDRR